MQDVNVSLRQERGELLREAKKLHARGNLSDADTAKFNDLIRRAKALKVEIETIENGMTAGVLGGDFVQQDDPDPHEFRGGPQHQQRRETPKEKEHRAAFMNYLRLGTNLMPQEQRALLEKEYRDMGSGGEGAYPGATVGFFVPVGFVNQICEALKFYGPLLDGDVSTIWDTATGQPLPYPTENDTLVVGERIGEGQQVTSQDVSLGQIMFGAWKYSSKMVKISIELLQDSAFNLETFLISTFAKRLGRALVADFTTGLGSAFSMPLGILTSTLQSGNLVAAVGSSSNDGTSAGGNTIGSDDLINLEHSIDVLYRPGASYMAHDSTWKAVRKLKDKYGNMIWQRSLIAGQPDTINGYRMLTNNFMPTLQLTPSSPTVTVNSVLFGDMRRFLVRRVMNMSILVLRERYADYGQVGYLCFARYDSSPLFGGSGAAFPFGLLQNTF